MDREKLIGIIERFVMFEFQDNEGHTLPVPLGEFMRSHPDFCKVLADHILQSLPSLSEQEVERILPKKKEYLHKCPLPNLPYQTQCAEYMNGYNQAISDCKTALLERGRGK